MKNEIKKLLKKCEKAIEKKDEEKLENLIHDLPCDSMELLMITKTYELSSTLRQKINYLFRLAAHAEFEFNPRRS